MISLEAMTPKLAVAWRRASMVEPFDIRMWVGSDHRVQIRWSIRFLGTAQKMDMHPSLARELTGIEPTYDRETRCFRSSPEGLWVGELREALGVEEYQPLLEVLCAHVWGEIALWLWRQCVSGGASDLEALLPSSLYGLSLEPKIISMDDFPTDITPESLGEGILLLPALWALLDQHTSERVEVLSSASSNLLQKTKEDLLNHTVRLDPSYAPCPFEPFHTLLETMRTLMTIWGLASLTLFLEDEWLQVQDGRRSKDAQDRRQVEDLLLSMDRVHKIRRGGSREKRT